MKSFKNFLSESGVGTSEQNMASDMGINPSEIQNPKVLKTLNAYIGAIANIGLCLLLIPFYNEFGKAATGAAIATCISFMIMFIVMYYQNKKLYPIQLEWTNIGLLAVFIFVGFIISNFMGDNPFLNIIITIMYPYSLIKIGIIRLKLIQEFFGKSL